MNRLLFVLFLSTTLCIYAQENVSVVIDLAEAEVEKKTAVPFAALQVIDARFDKSNIGCADETVSVHNKKLHKTTTILPDSLHKYLPFAFEKLVAFNKESKDTLLMLIKQFRLVDHMMDAVLRQYEPKSLLKISASFFRLKDNQLTRLFSVDDLFINKWKSDKFLDKALLAEFRKESLIAALQSFFTNKHWQPTGASFPMQIVKEGIEKRFQLPVYNRSALVTGVYKTFKEFKNNQPSITNLVFKKQKDGVEVLDSAGHKLDLRNYWGICYETKQYILFRGELNELFPSDKSFRFLSYSQTSDLAGRASFGEHVQQQRLVPAMLIKSNHNRVSQHYFYLNMDEEEIYLEEVFGRTNLKQMQKDLLK